MAAVDLAGPLTPLSDPLLTATVFIPNDEALAAALRAASQAPASGSGSHQVSDEQALANLLNALTVPGRPLRAEELLEDTAAAPVRLLAASGGELLVQQMAGERQAAMGVSPLGAAAGPLAPVVEADLQSGNVVAHVVGAAAHGTPALAGVATRAAAGAAARSGGGSGLGALRFTNALSALQDPAVGVQRFAALVEAAGLTAALADEGPRSTVFAPSDKVCTEYSNGWSVVLW